MALSPRLFLGRGPKLRQGAGAVLASILVTATGLLSCSDPPAPPPEPITFSLGTNVDFARALIAHYNSSLSSLHVSENITYGAFVVVAAVQNGLGDLGIAQVDAVYQAYRYGVDGDRKPHTQLRGMAVLGMNAIHVIVGRNSPILSIGDLRGKRVGLLEPGTSSEYVARILLGAHGMSYPDIQPVHQLFPHSLTQVKEGFLDAIIVAASLDSFRLELERAEVRSLSVDSAVIRDIQMSYPFLRPVDISTRELWGQDDAVRTLGADAVLVCRDGLPEETVYQLVKELFAILPALARIYPDAARVVPDLASTTPIPLHAGAARFYREQEILR